VDSEFSCPPYKPRRNLEKAKRTYRRISDDEDPLLLTQLPKGQGGQERVELYLVTRRYHGDARVGEEGAQKWWAEVGNTDSADFSYGLDEKGDQKKK
jgi:hypothetical protein